MLNARFSGDVLTVMATIDDEFRFEGDWVVGDDGEIEPTAFRVLPALGQDTMPPNLGERLVKRLGMPRLVDHIGEFLDSPMAQWSMPARWVDAAMAPRRTGRRGTPDVFYARWAELYVQALEQHPKSPVKALSAEHGLSAKAITEYLRKARSRRLLTPAAHGKAGGQLTPYALELLGRS